MSVTTTQPTPVPKALSAWFVVHFVLDVLAATPIFLFPGTTLALFGYNDLTDASILLARIVAAALFGIGIESFLGRNASPQAFKAMLNLKIIWSLSASLGILWSMIQTHNYTAWWILVIFAAFHLIWVYWRVRMDKEFPQDGHPYSSGPG